MHMRRTGSVAVGVALLVSACGTATPEPAAQAQGSPSASVADTNRYFDAFYGCLNSKGYKFIKAADGGWSGQTGVAGEPYEKEQERYKAAADACNAELGVDSRPRPAPTAS